MLKHLWKKQKTLCNSSRHRQLFEIQSYGMEEMIYVKQRSIPTGIMYLSYIPDNYKLLPSDESYEQIKISKEEFENTKKEYINRIILNGINCELYKQL